MVIFQVSWHRAARTAALFALSFSAWAFLTPIATALPDQLVVAARRAVNQTLYASSATSSAAEQQFDARFTEQRRVIQTLHDRITHVVEHNETLSSQLSEAQEHYCADLAARDRAYAQEIAVLRRAAEDIAATTDGLAALDRFNTDDELGALVILDRLRDARDRARQVRNNIESAAEARDIATLAFEARARGRQETRHVTERYQEVTRLDPGVAHDWINLAILYRDGGAIDESRHAAEQGLRVASSDGDRYDLQHELGRAHAQSGDLLRALAAHQQAHEIARQMATAHPQDIDAQRSFVRSIETLADMVRESGDEARVIALLQEGTGAARAMVAAWPDSPIARESLARMLDLFGRYSGDGNCEIARPFLDRSLALYRQLIVEAPESVDLKISAIAVSQPISACLADMGDDAQTLEFLRSLVQTSSALLAQDPESFHLLGNHSSLLQSVAGELWELGDTDGAIRNDREALAIADRLSVRDPSSAYYMNRARFSHGLLASALAGAGDLVEARTHRERAVQIARALTQRNPNAPSWLFVFAQATRELGALLIDQGDWATARSQLGESLSSLRQILRRAPNWPDASSTLALVLRNYSRLSLQAGDLATARSQAEESVALCRALLPRDPTARRQLVASLGQLFDVLVATKASETSVAMTELIALARTDAAATPNLRPPQLTLARLLTVSASYQLAVRDFGSAEALLNESFQILNRQIAASPQSAPIRRQLVTTLRLHGDLAQAQNDAVRAARFLHQALDISRPLATTTGRSQDHDAEASLLVRLAVLEEVAGRHIGTRQFTTAALSIYEDLLSRDPENSTWSSQVAHLRETLRHLPEAFLEEVRVRPGVVSTASGLLLEHRSRGTDQSLPHPSAEARVQIHFEGRLADGSVFDSSFARGAPVWLPLSRLVRGFSEAVQQMRPGDEVIATFPAALGYGDHGVPPNIPGGAPLQFRILLLAIQEPGRQPIVSPDGRTHVTINEGPR